MTELDPAPAALLTGLSCDDGDSSVDLVSRTATIVVAQGEHVTCTFTNTAQRGTFTIAKQVLPPGSSLAIFSSDDPVGAENPSPLFAALR